MNQPAHDRQALVRLVLVATASLLLASPAHADNLQAGPDAPLWARLGADALLWLHIGGGALGLLTGVLALAARKGGKLHRAIGLAFVAAMAVTYAIGAGVAPFLEDGQRPNFVAGVMALYLLVTGWMAARSRSVIAGPAAVAGLVFALLLMGAGLTFMYMGANSPTGTVDGSPPPAFFLFAISGAFAAAGEIHVLVRRQLTGVARIARHLWRMCFSLFIASGSFFLGQMQVLPEAMRESAAPYILALAPLAAMAFWLARVRIAGWFRKAAPRLAQ